MRRRGSRLRVSQTLDISGLQSYYKLNGNGDDSIGIKNAETINAVTYQAGSSGSEAIFNGYPSYVKLPAQIVGSIFPLSIMSLSGFITTNSEATISRFLTLNGGVFGIYVSLRTNSDGGKLSIAINTSINTTLTTNNITLTNRNFIVVTINKNGFVKLYINGILDVSMLLDSNTGGYITPSPANYLGAARNGTLNLSGKMEDWGFWNVELTQERVTAISNHQISGNELI